MYKLATNIQPVSYYNSVTCNLQPLTNICRPLKYPQPPQWVAWVVGGGGQKPSTRFTLEHPYTLHMHPRVFVGSQATCTQHFCRIWWWLALRSLSHLVALHPVTSVTFGRERLKPLLKRPRFFTERWYKEMVEGLMTLTWSACGGNKLLVTLYATPIVSCNACFTHFFS